MRPIWARHVTVCRLSISLSLGLAFCACLWAEQTVADDPNPEATRQYAVAHGFQSKKLFAQAIPRWTTFLQVFPKDERTPNAYFHLGVCQLQEKKLPESAATFRHLLATFPQFKSLDAAQFNLGMALFQAAQGTKQPNDFKNAAAEFANVTTKFPQSLLVAEATFHQAESLYFANDKPNALAIYQKLIASFPNAIIIPDALYGLSVTQQDLAQHAEAVTTLTTLLQKVPNGTQAAEAKLRLGTSLIAQKKWADAEPHFAQATAVADFPLADVALYRHGQTLFELGKFGESATLLETFPTKFPKSDQIGPALTTAGKARFRAAQWPQAQTLLNNVVQTKGTSTPEAAYWLARTLIALKQPANVIPMIDPVIAANGQSEFIPHLQLVRLDAISEIPDRRKETVTLYSNFAAQFAATELAPEAKYKAALMALNVADFAQAQAQAEQFLATPPFAKHALLPDVLFVGAEAFLFNQPTPNLAKAEPLYRRLTSEFPASSYVPRAQVRIGLCLYSTAVTANQPAKFDDCVTHLNQVVGALKEPAQLAEARLLTGRAHGEQKRHAEAIAAFRATIQAKPDWDRSDEALLGLGVSLRVTNDLNAATVELTKLNQIANSKLRDRALFHLAEIDRGLKKYDSAIAFYQQLLANFPASDFVPSGLYGMAAAQFEKPDLSGTLTNLNKLIAEKPQSDIIPAALLLRGICLSRLKQFDPALKDLAAFLATNKAAEKELWDAKFTTTLCQMGLKQYENAITTLNEILTKKPDYADGDKCFYELAFANLELKKENEAVAAFRSLVSKYPNSPLTAEAWCRIGENHETHQRWAEAAQAFNSGLATAKAPELRERLYFRLAWSQYEQKQFAPAIASLQTQLKEFPQGALLIDAHFLAGECQYRQDKFADAIPMFSPVIASKSDRYHATALYRSGQCTLQLKQWSQAQQHFSALLQIAPNYQQIHEARFGLGFALQNQNQFDQAQAHYLQVTKDSRTETAAKARFMMGQCAFAKKQFVEATEHFLEAAFGYPYDEWQCQAHFEAARCFIELKDIVKARDSLETILKRFPNHVRAKDATSLLSSLK